MTGAYPPDNRRKFHSTARRNKWFGLMFVDADVLNVLLGRGRDAGPDMLRAGLNVQLRPLLDRHYETAWPAGPPPYTSIDTVMVADETSAVMANIHIETWPGDYTHVFLHPTSAWERKRQLGGESR